MPKIPEGDEVSYIHKGREKIAINLFDLTRVPKHIRILLLTETDGHSPRIGNTAIRMSKERLDEAGVEFVCDLLTAACICDSIRQADRRAGEYPCRVYLKKASAWTKLAHGDVLTKVSKGGKVYLNPKLFCVKTEIPSLSPERLD